MMSRSRIWLAASILLVLVVAFVVIFFPVSGRRPPGLSSAIQQNDLLNAADPKMGALTFKGCAACHSSEKDGPNMVGPNLFRIVGAPIASEKNYAYSDALLMHKEKFWTTDELYEWLRDPAEYAPGTKMAYEGLLDPQDRMDLISYLMTLK